MENKVIPFCNMHDYTLWTDSNCTVCKKINCKEAVAIIDSTLETYIPINIAENIGFKFIKDNPESKYIVLNRKCNMYE